MEKGNLSINSENILPIIKKWLYSDMDIFLRELVSNGCDAVTKLQKLREMGEAAGATDEKYCVKVILDEEGKTITISDNGIGMTAEEIKKYINQIAFSGAGDFIEKYKDKISGDDANEIIGHFGLGFYSAFMVADTVEIDSLSYQENAVAAHWLSDGGVEFEISESGKQTRGTDIILHVSEENKDFLSEFKLKEILRKYCSFMPVEIYFEKIGEKKDTEETEENEENEEIKDIKEEPINDTKPLWLKPANECTDEEYKEFYANVFFDFEEPLFWIHLNMDYPFRLKGILYFPKLKNQYETIEGQVKLYCNQVFVADNVKEVIPEFLLLLKGTIDCPDIPLNVSRSFLQNDANVAKMSSYITRKVADKLNSLYKKDKDEYCGYWNDINVFIKYGCIKDKKFYEKIEDSIVYKTINDEYKTINELLELNADKDDKSVYYASDISIQAQYINMFKEASIEAVVLPNAIDNPFISYVESYNSQVKFKRIDSDISGALKSDAAESEETDGIQEFIKDIIGNDKLKIEAQTLKNENIPAVIVLSEQSRRMQEMSKMYSTGMDFPLDETLVLNKNSSLVKALAQIKENGQRKEDAVLIANQIYDLAKLSQKPFSAEELTNFVDRSNKILEILAKKG